ncbi:MAG TPA: LysE family transporter [Candidatus Cybelea sp.]|nr:LysE family transporter [Candidatus Cybelea sp.]
MLEVLLEHIGLLLKGAGIGFAVAAPVGPIGMLCIRTTLERGRVAGFAAGLGAAVADAIYGTIGVLGVAAINDVIAAERSWLELGGGIFIVLFGIRLGLKKPVIQNGDMEIPISLFADFSKTLLLTLANPSTVLTFIAIFAGVSAGQAGLAVAPVIVLGVLLGSAAWWLLLSQGVGVIRHRISERAMVWMNWSAGLLLVAFGTYTLGALALQWLG